MKSYIVLRFFIGNAIIIKYNKTLYDTRVGYVALSGKNYKTFYRVRHSDGGSFHGLSDNNDTGMNMRPRTIYNHDKRIKDIGHVVLTSYKT